MDWLRIVQLEHMPAAEELNFNKINLLTSLETVGNVLASRIFTPIEIEAGTAAPFLAEFTAFGWIFLVVAGMLAVSFLFTLCSMAACSSTTKRAALSYLGFSLATAAPILFIYAVSMVNSIAASFMPETEVMQVVEVTLFPYIAILAGILAMVYCPRYPVVSDVKGRRTPLATRMITSFVPVKGDGIKESLRKVVFTTALICFFFFGSRLGIDLFNSWRADMLAKQHSNMIGQDVDLDDDAFAGIRELNPLPDYLALYERNNDMVGYIRIGATRVDYPVLQTTNNRFYLDHNFNKEVDRFGAIFADRRNHFEREHGRISDNTILYGHNTSTGNFFAALSNYHRGPMRDGNLDFYKTNPTVTFDTLFERMEWKVFGVVLFNTQEEHGEVYDYWHQLEFRNEDHFHNFILDIMDRSVMFTDVDIEYGDKILTLSTCYWPYTSATHEVDTRCVIFARRVRPGEDPSVNVNAAEINHNNLRFALEARRLGTNWNGRTWDYRKYLTSYNG
jgi:sortase B